MKHRLLPPLIGAIGVTLSLAATGFAFYMSGMRHNTGNLSDDFKYWFWPLGLLFYFTLFLLAAQLRLKKALFAIECLLANISLIAWIIVYCSDKLIFSLSFGFIFTGLLWFAVFVANYKQADKLRDASDLS